MAAGRDDFSTTVEDGDSVRVRGNKLSFGDDFPTSGICVGWMHHKSDEREWYYYDGTDWIYAVNGRFPQIASGYYRRVPELSQATGTGTLAAAARVAYPIYIARRQTFDQLACEVTTAAGAGSARLGIYESSGGLPGDLIVDGGTVDLSSAAVKTIAISETLSPGWYWLAFHGNNGSTTYRGGVANTGPEVVSQSGTNFANPCKLLYNTWSFAPLPDPFGAVTASSAAFGPLIWIRAS